MMMVPWGTKPWLLKHNSEWLGALCRKDKKFLLYPPEVQTPMSVRVCAHVRARARKRGREGETSRFPFFSWCLVSHSQSRKTQAEDLPILSRGPYHQPPHSLLLDPLRLLLLLPFGVSVPSRHCFGQLLDLPSHGPMIFLKIFRMLQNTVQVFLQGSQEGEKDALGPLCRKGSAQLKMLQHALTSSKCTIYGWWGPSLEPLQHRVWAMG